MKTNNDTLSRATKELCWKEQFYGLFLMMLNKEWNDELPTAGVSKNGINYQLSINPIFWESLKDVWQLMILKHELNWAPCIVICK